MEKTIRWGIMGLGNIAHKFAEALKVVPNAQLVAVGSRSMDTARTFAIQYNVTLAFSNYADLASCPNVDVVYIATPHVLHYENTLMCLQNGKAVLCEKPFAMNKKQVLAMVALAKEKNVFLMEAMWTRFLPTVEKCLEIIRNGDIGNIVHIKSDFGFKAPYNISKRLFNKDLGGGSLLDIGIYPVFITLLLLGKPLHIKSNLQIGATGVDESMTAILEYKSGTTASIYSTLMASTPVETDIEGTLGRIRIHRMWHMPSYITLTLNDGTATDFHFNWLANGYEFEAKEVTKCLQADKKESEALSLSFSLDMIGILDTIRANNNLIYSADS